MDDDRRAFSKAWKYRMAVRRFQSAFEAVDGLADAERRLLLEQVANWLLEHMPGVPSQEPRTAEVASEIDQVAPSHDDEPPEAA